MQTTAESKKSLKGFKKVCYCAGEGQAPQAAVPSEAAPGGGVISLLAKSGSAKTNGTHNGETNGRLSVLIGGANAFASSTTDGTGDMHPAWSCTVDCVPPLMLCCSADYKGSLHTAA